MAHRSLPRRLWYGGLKFACWTLAIALFRVRFFGRHRIPAAGGVLVLANHQSYLDPILVGIACDRRLNYVARATLFHFGPFAALCRSLDTIPIDRDGTGLTALKVILRRLKQGEMVLVFPEGTRTSTGALGELRPGFCAVARRAGVPILPVVVEGAFQAWPRTRWFPRPTPIAVHIAAPILPPEVARNDNDQLLSCVARRLRVTQQQAQRQRHRARRDALAERLIQHPDE